MHPQAEKAGLVARVVPTGSEVEEAWCGGPSMSSSHWVG